MNEYYCFAFFKIDPKWRWMSDLAKNESAKEVEIVLKNHNTKIFSYSTLGLHHNMDFLILIISNSLEDIQKTISKLYNTVFGKYIIHSYNYISTKRKNELSEKSTLTEDIKKSKYMTVCIFNKNNKWHKLENHDKQELINKCTNLIKKNQIIINYNQAIEITNDEIITLEDNNIDKLQNTLLELKKMHILLYIDCIITSMCIKSDLIQLIISLG